MLDTCVIWRRGSRKEKEYETTQNWDGYIGENAGEIKVNRGCLIVKIMYNDIQQHSWLAEMRANIVNETFLGKRRVYIVLNTIWQCCFTPHPPTPSFSTHMKAPSYNLMTFKDTYIAWRAVSSCWGGGFHVRLQQNCKWIYELRIHQNYQHLTPEMVYICFCSVWNRMYLERCFNSGYSPSLMIRPTECQ